MFFVNWCHVNELNKFTIYSSDHVQNAFYILKCKVVLYVVKQSPKTLGAEEGITFAAA